MQPLIDKAWRLYLETPDPCVVRPSIPILYFGDHNRYVASSLKVITVALNPSRHEFPVHDQFVRFRPVEDIGTEGFDLSASAAYSAALNGYFRLEPYMSWFGWFEHVLLGMGASYRDGAKSTALHTDLCSPLATDPTWSKLDGRRDRLAAEGMALWHDLVELLAPDVIVISVARQYRDQIAYADPLHWRPLITIERQDPAKRSYHALMQWAALQSGKETLLVFGPAAQQPFATLTQGDRQRVGRKAREMFDAG
jgi:hypothetical protein